MIFGYCRFSPSKDCGPNLSKQINSVVSRAAVVAAHHPIKFYIDADKTGLLRNMGQFNELINRVAESKPALLIVDKLERLGCDRGLLTFFEIAKKHNLTLISLEPIDCLEGKQQVDNWGSVDPDKVIDWLVDKYNKASEKLSERAKTHKTRSGTWGRKKVEIPSEQLEKAKLLRATGVPLTAIAAQLQLPYSPLRRRLKESESN